MKVLAAHSWSLGGADSALDLPELAPGHHPASDPPRPEAVEPGVWRRMSRLARLAAAVAAPAISGREDLDRLPLLWGTAWGEFSSTAAFLRTLFTKGPAGASPLLFQNAVHNAPAGHLSIALGLRGPSETICAGPATLARVLERADAWIAARGGPVLVVLADDLGPDVRRGLDLAGGTAAFGEASAALLLDAGRGLSLSRAPLAGAWRRAQPYPSEALARGEGTGHDLRIGLSPAADAVALVAVARAGAGAVALPEPSGVDTVVAVA